MSAAGLFAVGTVVTLIVFAALGLLAWGVILDGREVRARAEAAREEESSQASTLRLA